MKQHTLRNLSPSEATIQAELYVALRRAGRLPMLNHSFEIDGVTPTGQQRRILADVVVVCGRSATCAIEVKDNGPRLIDHYASSEQYQKYVMLGLPFNYCTHLGQIPFIVRWVEFVEENIVEMAGAMPLQLGNGISVNLTRAAFPHVEWNEILEIRKSGHRNSVLAEYAWNEIYCEDEDPRFASPNLSEFDNIIAYCNGGPDAQEKERICDIVKFA